MSKNLASLRHARGPLLASIIVLLLIGIVSVGIYRNATTATAKPVSNKPAITAPLTANVVIPKGQEVFDPFIQTIGVHGSITWHNQDSVDHVLMTTWNQSAFLNPEPFSMTLPANQSVTFTFTQPGVYHYFDGTQASWNTTSNRVVAKKGVPNYPLAMDGVIWVQGPISHLPQTGQNMIPKGQDDFAIEFLAITQGGTVSWHNNDTDGHTLASAFGWSAPINPGNVILTQINGTATVPDGETKTLTFHQPGLYYYYCPNHATINSKWRRAQANTDASLYPVPMEGFVLVMG